MSDRRYLEEKYLSRFGRPLDLENPKTFSEKIIWLNLYYRNPMLTKLVDKHLVKEYVCEKVGGQYLCEELGVYDTVEEFEEDLRHLPMRFVIRATHGSGWNRFIEDKSQITEEDLSQLRSILSSNYYQRSREWAYKDIEPRLLCEQFIEPVNPSLGLVEYMYYCFHGEPKFLAAVIHRSHLGSNLDLVWNRLPVMPRGSRYLPLDCPRPATHELMIELARTLSEDLPFVRVDFYSENEVIFGEMTLYPSAGMVPFEPDDYDYKFGELLDLAKIPERQIDRKRVSVRLWGTPYGEER